VAALAIAESSATEARAAHTGCVLCRGLDLSGATVPLRDFDAWVQLSCPAGRVLRAQLPPDSQVWRRWQLLSRLGADAAERRVCAPAAPGVVAAPEK
jgi:hypothetical protein